jgi:antitoxin HicB
VGEGTEVAWWRAAREDLKMPRVYTVALLRGNDGAYSVLVPALPGCFTQGPNLAEALDRVKEAISCHIESLEAHGEPVPEDDSVITVDLDDANEALLIKVTVGEAVPVA